MARSNNFTRKQIDKKLQEYGLDLNCSGVPTRCTVVVKIPGTTGISNVSEASMNLGELNRWFDGYEKCKLGRDKR